jgi:excinuclease UvrABC helicase subunit UvrB
MTDLFTRFSQTFSEFPTFDKFNFSIPEIKFPADTDDQFIKTEWTESSDESERIVTQWKSKDGRMVYSKSELIQKNKSLDRQIYELEQELNATVKDRNYEKAIELRDQINKLQETQERA